MAKVFLVGIHDMNFSSRDGGRIDGIALQCNYPDRDVIGLRADSKFISREICNAVGFTVDTLRPFVQHSVELETNLKGKVVGIKMAEE